MIVRRVHSVDPADITFDAFSTPDAPRVGSLILRPYYYAHSFELSGGPLVRRTAADALLHFSRGFVSHAQQHARPGEFAPAGTLFHVLTGNDTMARFIESHGGLTEPDTRIYRIDH